MKIRVTERDIERFDELVYPDPNSGCFLFVGSEFDGYGRFDVRRAEPSASGKLWVSFLAHKFAWIVSGRDIGDRDCLLHVCDQRCCVNVDHMVIGTRRGRVGSKYPFGVYRNGADRYTAHIKIDGKRMSLGTYRSVEEAAVVAAAKRDEIYPIKGV